MTNIFQDPKTLTTLRRTVIGFEADIVAEEVSRVEGKSIINL